MKKTRIFNINGENLELPVFEKGDRVQPTESVSLVDDAVGTVKSTSSNGLFVKINWDKKEYTSKTGGTVALGSRRLVNAVALEGTISDM